MKKENENYDDYDIDNLDFDEIELKKPAVDDLDIKLPDIPNLPDILKLNDISKIDDVDDFETHKKEIEDMDLVCMDRDVPLSRSKLWEYQTQYFDTKGHKAWQNEVPFYITSNAVIANSYAQVIFRYIQDSIKNNNIDREKPIYMVELGTGIGKFSFLFLTAFTSILESYGMADLPFCYVITDFTDKNTDYIQNHDQFQKFIQKGVLDFGIYDVTKHSGIHLINKKFTINKKKCQNPLIIFANYVFDGVPMDLFHFENNVITEGCPNVSSPSENLERGKVKSLDKLLTFFQFKPAKKAYYNDPHLNEILDFYKENIKNSSILMPLTAFHSLNHFREFSDQVFILSMDKGYTSMEALEGLSDPHIAFHGSFSLMVNYHSIAEYVKKTGGDCLLNTKGEGMKISAITLGSKFSDLPETRLAYNSFIKEFSTDEFLCIKNILINNSQSMSLKDIFALLKLSKWDPDIMFSIANVFIEKMINASDQSIAELKSGLEILARNIYYIPQQKNFLFEMGRLYYCIKDMESSLKYYQLSMEKFGEEWAVHFNIGLVQYYLNNLPDALESFENALKMDAASEQTKEWIDKVKEEISK